MIRTLPVLLALLAAAVLVWSDGAPRHAAGGEAIEPNFVRDSIEVEIASPTSLAFGPDGRLYAAGISSVHALTLDPATKDATAVEVIDTGLDDVMGLAFDPNATAEQPVFYISRRDQTRTDGFESVITRYAWTGSSWQTDDIITGLPTSRPSFNHLTNGLAFDTQGRLLIAQGSATDAGVPSQADWPETPLSAAILVADIHDPDFDGHITYTPPGPPTDHEVEQAGGDVSVFASGLRNPWDLVVHSSGNILATDNGPIGNTVSTSCDTQGSSNERNDELNLIQEGAYYGHPNRNRGRTEPLECQYLPPSSPSGAGYVAPAAVLPPHCSCNGIDEFRSDVFGGTLQGDLVIAQWVLGQLALADVAPDGATVNSLTVLRAGLAAPLDVIVADDGTIFFSEFTENRIGFLAPDTDRDGCSNSRELGPNPVQGGQRDPDSFWDFFDTPDAGNQRDRVVVVTDILRVVQRFGTSGSPSLDPLSAPPPAGYHTAFDRSPPLAGAAVWQPNAPDGTINIGDVFLSVVQFGHAC